ncbi:Uncharacterised protein [Enterobacter cloacae]|nr:Uncharacterised protein [Enterobacter cloacae]
MVVINILVAEILNKLAIGKCGVPAIYCAQIIGFALTGRFRHRINGYAVINPAGGIAGK